MQATRCSSHVEVALKTVGGFHKRHRAASGERYHKTVAADLHAFGRLWEKILRSKAAWGREDGDCCSRWFAGCPQASPPILGSHSKVFAEDCAVGCIEKINISASTLKSVQIDTGNLRDVDSHSYPAPKHQLQRLIQPLPRFKSFGKARAMLAAARKLAQAAVGLRPAIVSTWHHELASCGMQCAYTAEAGTPKGGKRKQPAAEVRQTWHSRRQPLHLQASLLRQC